MLIQRALVEQTGRSMLDPVFDSAIAQQEALYEGTVSFLLDNPEISLGDTLTAAQRARVDAPMLWYVEREIDGVRVLAPELILPESRLAAYGYQPGGSVRTVESLFIEGDSVRNTGALVAGSGLTILAGEFINERRVAAFRDGRNLHSRIQAGGLVSADDLMIITDGDLINRGGTLYGTQALTLAAGGDIRFEAQRVVNDIRSRGNAVGSWSHYSERHYAASAGTAGDMQIVADGGLSLLGSRLMADGDIALSARDGISVASVTDIEENHESRRSNRFFSRRSTSFGETGALNLGSLIAAGGDLGAVTAGDIAIHASDLTAGDDLLLAAGAGEDGRADASITITAGTDNRARYHQEKTSAVGLFFGGGRLDFYRARNTREETMQADNRPSTLTAGGDARLVAPGDVTLQGSVVGAGGMAELIAGRDLAVTAGEEARERLFSERRSNFGFSVAASGGGASLSLGLTRSSVRDDRNRTSDVGSLIGGGEGGPSGGRARSLGRGRRAHLARGYRSSGGAGSRGVAGCDRGDASAGGAAQLCRCDGECGHQCGERGAGSGPGGGYVRLGLRQCRVPGDRHGLGGCCRAWMRCARCPIRGVSASLSLGFSQSRMSQTEQLSDVVPAYFDAGGDLTFAAGRDLSLRAVQARSGGDLLLSAGRDLAIESAQATYWRAQRHSSASASVGLDMGWSVAGGPSVGVTLSGQVAGGRADASGTGQVESTLQAGRTLAVLTGNDALIAGAQLRGRDVALDIGGDLHVASRADTARLRGSSYQAGASLTIGLIGPSSLSLNLGGGRERADSTLVNRQTSIIADQRLDAYVEGHTQLDGGLIASLNGDLSLDTGTLSFTDIEERARSDSRRASASIGLGGNAPSIGVEGELAHEATDAITRATIGEGAITIRDEDAQRAREEAGETRDVAALNRDLDAARETLRDERAGVRFYASDSAIVELGNGFETTRGNLRELSERLSSVIENLSEEHGERLEGLAEAMPQEASEEEKAAALADDLVAHGEITEDQRDAEAEAIIADAYMILSDPDVIDEAIICEPGGRQGFNLHDLLFPRAHANPLALCIAASQWAARALLSWSIAKKAEENISQMAENSGRPGIGHNNPPPDQQLGPEDYQTGQGGPDGPQTPRPPVGTVVVGGAVLGQNWSEGNPSQPNF